MLTSFESELELSYGKPCIHDPILPAMSDQEKDHLYADLWHACAGPLASVPRPGENAFYFPQGHMEQVEAYTNQDSFSEMPVYDLPAKILCKVLHVQLKADINTDEVYAQVTLAPKAQQEQTSTVQKKRKARTFSFSKTLTVSDASTHGGCSIPKQHADECFPPLNMSQQTPVQELVTKDLHGLEWRFRHCYRGEPRRHILSTGWSSFVASKHLVAGDSFIFIRGDNGELRVGIRRAVKLQKNCCTSLLSGHNMQHGILANALHAFSTGSLFTIYYRPWCNPSEFLIPCRKYVKCIENNYQAGTKFKMTFEGEDARKERFIGTVVGIESVDHIRWPGSEWRCLKVQWDGRLNSVVYPERVSPWDIELIDLTDDSQASILHQPKNLCSDNANSSSAGSSSMVTDSLLKCSVSYTPQGQPGVLHSEEMMATCTQELDAYRYPLLSRLVPPISKPLHQCSSIRNILLSETHQDFGLASSGTQAPTSYGCAHQKRKAPTGKNDIEVPLAQTNAGDKVKLFGVDLWGQMDLPSPTFECSNSMCKGLFVPPRAPQLKPHEKECRNHCSIKVIKFGTALGASVDLTCFDGYATLISELDRMFRFEGGLVDGTCGWQVTYVDNEGDMMLIGSYPWQEFLMVVRQIFIYPKENNNN